MLHDPFHLPRHLGDIYGNPLAITITSEISMQIEGTSVNILTL